MTVPQVVSVRAGRFRPHYDLAAQGPEVQQEMALGFLELGHGITLTQGLRGLLRLLRAVWREQVF